MRRARADSVRSTHAATGVPGASGRLLWLALLGLHTPAFLAVAETLREQPYAVADSGIRLAALLASLVFFLLKIADVRCLRLPAGWRTRLALLLVIGVMHLGVAERALVGDWTASPAQVGLVAVVGGLWQANRGRRLIGRLCRGLASEADATRLAACWFGRAWAMLDLQPGYLPLPATAPRAPPAWF